MYLFISHSSVNAEVAKKICELLESNGHECFLAPRDIRTGHEYAEEIIAGIERSDAVLLLLSEDANQSPHVLREIERAVSKHITIMVYKLEEVELSKSLEYFLMMHQWVNTKAGVDYSAILKAVNELAGREIEMPASQAEGSGKAIANDSASGKRAHLGSRRDNKKGRVKVSVWPVAVLVFFAVLCLGMGMFLKGMGDGRATGVLQADEENIPVKVAPGDTIIFGTYNGEPISWRVLHLSEDSSYAVVIARDILCMKAFDGAESGRYNYAEDVDYWGKDISGESVELQRLLRGDNCWRTSNIRNWLNSSEENVKYEGQAPSGKAMSSMKNAYDGEEGFLSGFSEEELEAILVTEVETDGEVTSDRVFLLSRNELDWFESADVKRYAEPTDAACQQDKTDWYEAYAVDLGVADFCWWLRDGSEEDGFRVYMVGNSYVQGELSCESAGVEGYGVRPAMTLDLTSGCISVQP